jgi:hypothetical protein
MSKSPLPPTTDEDEFLEEEEPKKGPGKSRKGRVGEVSKLTHPQVAQRLPREKGALIAPMGDGMTVLERALAMLGDRVKETRQGFKLDGKACNTKDILKAAGLKFADE